MPLVGPLVGRRGFCIEQSKVSCTHVGEQVNQRFEVCENGRGQRHERMPLAKLFEKACQARLIAPILRHDPRSPPARD